MPPGPQVPKFPLMLYTVGGVQRPSAKSRRPVAHTRFCDLQAIFSYKLQLTLHAPLTVRLMAPQTRLYNCAALISHGQLHIALFYHLNSNSCLYVPCPKLEPAPDKGEVFEKGINLSLHVGLRFRACVGLNASGAFDPRSGRSGFDEGCEVELTGDVYVC